MIGKGLSCLSDFQHVADEGMSSCRGTFRTLPNFQHVASARAAALSGIEAPLTLNDLFNPGHSLASRRSVAAAVRFVANVVRQLTLLGIRVC